MRTVLKSKIHRAWVTDANPDYVGSMEIDGALMEKVDLWTYEKVLVCNVTNGNRWETYVIPGDQNSGTISVLGAGARLCEKGDCLIIMSFEMTDEPKEPKMIRVDQNNRFVEYVRGEKHEARVH